MFLAAWLVAEKMTQAEFAAKIGRSDASISRLCNGLQKPDFATLLAIERETGGQVTTKDFADLDPNQPAPQAASAGG